jgi:hypothetical protein
VELDRGIGAVIAHCAATDVIHPTACIHTTPGTVEQVMTLVAMLQCSYEQVLCPARHPLCTHMRRYAQSKAV